MAALVLLVAILAHAVLATAQTGVRIREIGVRKAVGATVGQVRCQFWGESVVMSFLGLGIGLVLAWVMAGPFGALVDRRIEVLGQLPGDLLGSFGLALVTGLLAGWYPALVLSHAAPTDVLRGTRSGRGRGRFSHGLMVVQLGLCVFLAVCVVVMAAQLLFLQRKDLGFDGDHVVAVPLGNNGTPEVVQAFRHRLRGAEGVVAVSATEHAPNISSLVATWRYSNEEVLLQGFRVDTGFMEAMGLRLVAGRWLDPTQDTPTGSVVVNETLVRRLGWSNPVGRRLDGLNPGPHGLGGFGLEEPVVVGVVQDFHTGEISRAIRPAVLRLPDRGVGFKALIVRLDPERMGAGLAAVQRVWREVAGKAEYRGFVLGEYLDGQGANTARWARLVRWSAGVALLIAGLSVFGLAAVEADRRTREIGVRKAMGASVPRLVALLLWDFTKPVLAANLVAWPAAWLAMETWLGSFAYHVPLRPGYFLLAGLAGVLIAWLTGAWHAVRVARANPMEALRQADG